MTPAPRRRRRRRQHTPVTVADLREALAAYTGEDSPVGLDPTRRVYLRCPDGALRPLVGVATSTLLGHGIVILDGADVPGETTTTGSEDTP